MSDSTIDPLSPNALSQRIGLSTVWKVSFLSHPLRMRRI